MSTQAVSNRDSMHNTGATGGDGSGPIGGTRSRPGMPPGRRARTSRPRRAAGVAGLATLGLLAVACGSSGHAPTAGSKSAGSSSAPVALRIGYFPNITHAPALVGVQTGTFAKDLAKDPDKDTLAEPQIFSAGPAENAALLSGSIDIAFEGPSSALSAYSSSKAVTIISGAASGGAGLVVDSDITSPSQLKGTKLGSPQLANTQDVALRYWLKTKGYTTSTTGGGDVSVEPSSTGSGTIVTEFEAKQIQGAWMPEPYEQELVAAGGHILVPEASLWPDGQWATTNVVVRNAFLAAHPATVKAFLQGLVDTLAFMKANKAAAEADANTQLGKLEGGKPLKTPILDAAWDNITFTANPEASTLAAEVAHGEAVGLLKNPGSLAPIYDLGPLNAVLAAAGQSAVPGL
jgi:NitT/TauT family transport system substrate-binding protein